MCECDKFFLQIIFYKIFCKVVKSHTSFKNNFFKYYMAAKKAAKKVVKKAVKKVAKKAVKKVAKKGKK